jgi:two-component system, OmpR family, sensor histidine kinase SenX3
MAFVLALTAIDVMIVIGLGTRALLGRHSEPAELSSTVTDVTAAELVENDASVPLENVDQVRTPDPAVGMESLRWLAQDQPGLEAADVARIEQLRHDFLAEVSHELKTPVGAVALLAEAILDAADDPHQVRRFGTKILHEANRLGTLVTELIALSRLQGAERLPELATVEVKDLVDQALARCRLAIEAANIQITVDAPTGLFLIGDAALLVTALSNLIDNAVSYSAPGSPVSVSARLANDLVEITVTDHGRGIEPEYQQRVFERFFRVDQALSRSTGGTGLGLAIVKRVAANHGGDILLWSKHGVGSTFTLRIPAHQPARHASRPSAKPEYATAPVQ